MIEKASYIVVIAALALSGLEFSKPSDQKITSTAFPKTLSEFGFFQDGDGFKPSSKMILYNLKTALFSDYSEKSRYIYIPDGGIAKAHGNGLIDFPIGSAIIKNFGFQTNNKMQLIETRVLLRREKGWVALPYIWNDMQNDAVLKLAGKRLKIEFTDPNGVVHVSDYAVPNKNQCKECHGVDNEVMPIGPRIRNLSPESIERLMHSGKMTWTGKRLKAEWDREGITDLDRKARAYLDINCGHCHNGKGSASNSGLFLNYEESNTVTYGIYKRPVAAGRGSGGLEFSIDPANPDMSILLHRMNSNEAGVAMPQIGRSIIHKEGVKLIRDWIDSLPRDENLQN